jgi:hypothetical protein
MSDELIPTIVGLSNYPQKLKDMGDASWAQVMSMVDAFQAPVTVTWNSSTAAGANGVGTTVAVPTNGYDCVVISLVATGTVSGGVVTFEIYDGAAWLPVKVFPMESYASYQTYPLSTGLNNGFQADIAGFPQFRVRLSTAITGSGSVTVTLIASSAPAVPGLVAGLDPAQPLPAGSNVIGTATQGSAFFNVDQNATAFAGAGRVNGTVVASPRNAGAVITANINVSALTLGTATLVFAILQESPDGVLFTDIWTSDPITATGNYRVPATQVAGRRRWSFFSVGGTSTTVTATITASELPSGYPLIRQGRDAYAATNPFSTMYNGAAMQASNFQLTVQGSVTAPFYIEGSKQLFWFFNVTGSPTVTTAPSLILQVSPDGVNWSGVTPIQTINGATTTSVTVSNNAKFARIAVNGAAVYSSGSYTVTNIGVNAVN